MNTEQLYFGFLADGFVRDKAIFNLKHGRCGWVLCGGVKLPKRDIIECISDPDKEWRTIVTTSSSGKERVCFSPSPRLRIMQNRLARYLSWKARWEFGTPAEEGMKGTVIILPSFGFSRGDSIIRNAERHQWNNSSLVLDLKDAFASIKTKHIFRFLKPSMGRNIAWVASRLLTYKGRLPQGAPSSPRVFNMMMQKFDYAMRETSGVTYTRYGDDLCFSTKRAQFPKAAEKRIREIVENFHLRLNHKRKVGQNGILPLPGVRIVHGRIEPDIEALERWAEAIKENKPPEVLRGYESFLGQFSRSGRRYGRKRLATLVAA